MLTADRLRSLFDYDPSTGLLVRRANGRVAQPSNAAGYVQAMVDGKMQYGHRLAWLHFYGRMPKGCVDHIDGDPANNRIDNLREATVAQNLANARRPAHNTSGYKGVSWNAKNKCWVAAIMVAQKRIHLGCAKTPEAAHQMYMDAARKHFGEFARAA